jgi:DNA-binding response OmpR family regulator
MASEEAPTARRVLNDRRAISVLLVDDQRFVGVAMERLLTGEDIELHCCFDAVDAVQRANQIGPTIIIQDLVLPDIDGLTMVKMFRANPPTAGTPIIMLSGNDDTETRSRAIAGGANDHLVKLPSRHDLIACIRRHAAATGVVDRNPSPTASAKPTAPSLSGPDETLDRLVIDQFRQVTTDGAPEFTLTLIELFIRDAAAQLEMLRDSGRRSGRARVEGHRTFSEGQFADHGGEATRSPLFAGGRPHESPSRWRGYISTHGSAR